MPVTYRRYVDLRLLLPAASAWAGAAYGITATLSDGRAQVVALTLVVLISSVIIGVRPFARRGKHARYPTGSASLLGVLSGFCFLATALSGTLTATTYMNNPLYHANGQRVCVHGAAQNPKQTEYSTWLTAVDLRAARGQVVLSTKTRPPVHAGDAIRTCGVLRSFGAAPTYGIIKPTALQPLPDTGIRAQLRAALEQNTKALTPDQRGLIAGMSIGDSSMLSTETGAAMRTTSTTHLTAISGTHLGIILATINLLIPGRGKIKATTMLGALLMLVSVVGLQPSLVRAGTMCLAVTVGSQLGRTGQSLSSLCATVICWLIINPWLARSYGFALSVCATVAVLFVLERERTAAAQGRVKSSGILGRICGLFAVGLAVQVFTTPLLLTMTGTYPLFAIPANILVAPAVAPTTLLGLLAFICPIPALSTATAHLASWSAQWIIQVTTLLAELPHASLQGNSARIACVITVVAVPIGWWVWARYRGRSPLLMHHWITRKPTTRIQQR
ncbi:ComEC/Rec2 family competence protein [Gleimia hominis]|uniref:ComEC/Rec2 family competence protein n=1 Tax=Gleimia hominis TaxID=595468 RepID=UPI000C7F9306|nr:ComEC/Rec2 family competence protein [Gleimia hominis]WIK64889.1 ComEC/Rec2 family competence protein [Gleimia hominis]